MVLRNKARVQANRAEMLNIATVISLYDADNDTFPVGATIGGLETVLETGRYMENCPTTDGWGNDYTYDGAAATYTLTSEGDGTTEIVITNGVFVGE